MSRAVRAGLCICDEEHGNIQVPATFSMWEEKPRLFTDQHSNFSVLLAPYPVNSQFKWIETLEMMAVCVSSIGFHTRWTDVYSNTTTHGSGSDHPIVLKSQKHTQILTFGTLWLIRLWFTAPLLHFITSYKFFISGSSKKRFNAEKSRNVSQQQKTSPCGKYDESRFNEQQKNHNLVSGLTHTMQIKFFHVFESDLGSVTRARRVLDRRMVQLSMVERVH